MKEFSVTLREKIRQIDYIIIICIVTMSLMSVVTLAGAADAYGANFYRTQLVSMAMGILCMGVVSMIDYDSLISKMKYVFFFVSIGLIIAVILFGSGERGNANWIAIPGLPFYIQPTEFAKVTYIICFALHIDRLKPKINHPLSVLQLGIHAMIIIGLVLLSGDLGMALVYIAIAAFMLFSSGMSLWYFALIGAVAVIAFPFIWNYMPLYQQQRILVGFNPDLDPLDKGWQAIASRRCIIAGGFRGAGFDGGSQYFSLSQGQSDFLFSVMAEKFGFIGTFAYIVLIVLLVVRILMIAWHTRKTYASYICMGMAGMLIAQTVENIGMCLAMLPVVGITLPFFSYGGSSMLSMYICMGVVQSISTHNRKYYFERELG
ncbi:MAG: rod shape-determining protein RodA [Ruminococcaceae bacterium]|nr:rod shape-determining protein RodA [Oscillospiraceae bacterium]